MELPSDWNAELEKGGSTCIGPAASMDDKKADYERAIDTLSDESRTSFAFVGKPESSSIDEIERSASDLAELGISSQLLVVNGYLPESVCEDPFFEGKRADEQAVIDRVESTFDQQALATYPLQPGEIAGLELLSDVGGVLYDGEEATVDVDAATRRATNEDTVDFDTFTDADAVAEELVPVEETRYLFFTGKGGVGKSTIASTTAVSLAEAGYETLVVTTDPAAHLADIFEQPVGHEPTSVGQANLDAARIDQERALEEYRTQVLDHVREMYDEKDDTQIDVEAAVANVEEELESPCAEEMAALEKFVSYFEEDGYDIVVFDTAPTGHTLRLLELPSDWKDSWTLGRSRRSCPGQRREVRRGHRDDAGPESEFVCVRDVPRVHADDGGLSCRDGPPGSGRYRDVGRGRELSAPEDYGDNAFFENRRAQQAEYLEEISERFDVPMMLAPLRQEEPVGLDDLREFGADVTGLDGVGEDDREEVTVS